MTSVKASASRCVLLGDLVGSRDAADRRALHHEVEAALAEVDATVPSLHGLRVTVGDEFQGAYASLGEAVEAAFRVRLALLPHVDTRFGLGRGAVTVLDPRRGIEDGPGWWAARAAVDRARELAGHAATRHARTAYRSSPPDGSGGPPDGRTGDPAEPAVNAALLCRDHLVGSLSDRSLRLLRGLMHPETTQGQLAEREGISASAVSQRVRSDGIGAVLAAHELLRGMP
jgi:SatD family (SatD)/Winged helix-turn-helix DNA-binding